MLYAHPMIEDPIIYTDGKDERELDLRPDGVDCIPVLGMSSYQPSATCG